MLVINIFLNGNYTGSEKNDFEKFNFIFWNLRSIKNINLLIPKNEHIGIVVINGAGKRTLFK